MTWRRTAMLAAAALACTAPSVRVPPTVTDVAAWGDGTVCYEIFIRSFADSDGDGVGDLKGLTARLDYVNDGNPASQSDLGATCVWLMPVAESPSYHGYDVSDYYRVDREYGTPEDFLRFMSEAHRRGIRVLVDLVLNHTSSEHPAFQAALRDTTSPYRAWYRFAPRPLGPGPWGMESWHKSSLRDEYYYGPFWKGMPDLNYATPAVREEAKKIAAYWLKEMRVDGFRLDAIPYMVEEGTCQMGCPGTHAFLHEFADHIERVRPGAYTVGEAWGNIDAVLPYYPDQLTSHFGFELADSLVAAAKRGTAGGVLSGFLRLQDTLPAWRWSPFLSNHDGTRVMTLLGGDARRARAAATLLLTLPGLPFVYYGEEIGMTGDKPDERLRTPMQWRAERGLGFSTGTPWEQAQPDSFRVTVAAQESDSASLLNHYRRLIHLRHTEPALTAGRLVPLTASSPAVVAFLRREARDAVLVATNLGAQPADVTIGSVPRVLDEGRYAIRALVGPPTAASLDVAADGSVQPLRPGILPAGGSVVLELRRR